MIVELSEIRRVAEMLAPMCEGDDDLFRDMLEGETEIDRVLARIWEQIARDNETLAGIKERKAALDERKSRIELRIEAGKRAIGLVLSASSLKKYELPEVTLSVRDGKPRLIVADKDAVPNEYQRFTAAPNMTAINEAFSDADELPNWLAVEPARPIVSARTR